VEAGAGTTASYPDADYQAAGARIGSAADALAADIVLKVRGPSADELPKLKSGAMLVGLLDPFDAAAIDACAKTGVTGFALESLPRISRAQAMDVLSSQANIAGYKAVVIAAEQYGKFMPMLMTAAGTVKAARARWAGVAGLQAIATAGRLVPSSRPPTRPSVRPGGSLGGAGRRAVRERRGRRSPRVSAATRGRCRRNGWRARPASSTSAARRWTS
jgi:NAD(P) transhydrogenase subunit alpha